VRTQAGYTDCKKALVETEGDILLKVRSYWDRDCIGDYAVVVTQSPIESRDNIELLAYKPVIQYCLEIQLAIGWNTSTEWVIYNCNIRLISKDMDKAIDWLRKKGALKAASKTDRVTAEGTIGMCFSRTTGVLIEVRIS
jgi:hypothetical protein